jgi:anthranilate synthase component 2
MHLLIIDNFDSFTYNLVDYFHQLEQTTTVVRNNVSIEDIEKINFDAIVLSPGPGTPANAGITMQSIEKYHTKKPILGICLGHQAIGEFFGWTLKKAKQPMHGKVSKVSYSAHPIFKDIEQNFSVMRYHSLIIEKPLENNQLKTIATTDENEVMMLTHISLPILGIQFHPEAILTRCGLTLLRNWISLCE